MRKRGYKEGEIVFNILKKTFAKVVEITTTNKGTLHTVEYVSGPTKEPGYGRYYDERMNNEFIKMNNTALASILFSDKVG